MPLPAHREKKDYEWAKWGSYSYVSWDEGGGLLYSQSKWKFHEPGFLYPFYGAKVIKILLKCSVSDSVLLVVLCLFVAFYIAICYTYCRLAGVYMRNRKHGGKENETWNRILVPIKVDNAIYPNTHTPVTNKHRHTPLTYVDWYKQNNLVAL